MPYIDPTPMIVAMVILYIPIGLLLSYVMLEVIFSGRVRETVDDEAVVEENSACMTEE